MNLVKRSLYLCIGTLLLMICVQGTLSLWSTWRLQAVSAQTTRGADANDRAERLWNSFLAAERSLKQMMAFTSVDDTEVHAQQMARDAADLREQARLMAEAGDAAEKAVLPKVEAWLALVDKHVSADGTGQLPAPDQLDLAHHALKDVLAESHKHIEEQNAELAKAGESIAFQVYGWTAAGMLVALALGAILGTRAMRQLHGQLGADASEVARVANAVAAGDLTTTSTAVNVPPGSVMDAMLRMQQALTGTVLNVRQISEGLATGVDEIAAGNSDLSTRTEHQAAELERTASTLDELGATVRQNAESAGHANQLAVEASRVATEGGAVVGEVVSTMQAINESSRRISAIIGVIDGIAFQTNILALNAAVEAARAGDHGRGFAVVASEVRALAQRSASAAREIKTLIEHSVERVDTGVELVEKAGVTMDEIVNSIARVSSMMSSISLASNEQSVGVEHVGRAINELDQATQQNAALAEQGAAASSSLRERGRQLTDAVAFFSLPKGTVQ